MKKLYVAKVSGKASTNGKIWWDYDFGGRHSIRRSCFHCQIKDFFVADGGGDLGGVLCLLFTEIM